MIPCLVLASINAWNLWKEHWIHWEHMPPLEERVEYPYQNLRTRNYFWGNGDKVSLSPAFWDRAWGLSDAMDENEHLARAVRLLDVWRDANAN